MNDQDNEIFNEMEAGFGGPVQETMGRIDFNYDEDHGYTNVPVIPLRKELALPYSAAPIQLEGEDAIELARKYAGSNQPVFLVYCKAQSGDVSARSFARVGVLAKLGQLIDDEVFNTLPRALALMGPRYKVAKYRKTDKKSNVFRADLSPLHLMMSANDFRCEMAMAEIKKQVKKLEELTHFDNSGEIMKNYERQEDDVHKLFYLSFILPAPIESKLKILEAKSNYDVMIELLRLLTRSLAEAKVMHDIYVDTNYEMSEVRRNAFLQTQLQLIQQQLGTPEEDDKTIFEKRASQKNWPESVARQFEKELGKLSRFNPTSPDYSIQYTYLDTILDLPWEKYRDDTFTLQEIKETLDRDHYGLEKVKERILEQMAVFKLRQDLKAPILCLVGPPGVGKTSLGKSIADAMGREFQRISFGGMHDESEIRGHRRTYIGAMPGRIIAALQRCQTSNPVIILDEIDKIGKDYKGDPANALLEVLDPEQNSTFHDNFVDMDYDLGKVLFIATANTLSTISAPLLDRMEIINLSGYIPAEKIIIAKRHLLPKQIKNHGLEDAGLEFNDDALLYVIERYTRESGVRSLEKILGKILRKIAYRKVAGLSYSKTVDADAVREYLGKEDFESDAYEGNEIPGIVTGLAWTSVGGEILFIETSVAEGKGKLSLTGNLGDVMKESATVALEYLKSHAALIGLEAEDFAKHDFHLHVPEGAVPKDGPSAGITMVTSIASALTGRKVRERLAMTGEISLRGRVLPVGGIKEKILAARRAGITEIILSSKNRKDIEEIGAEYIDGLTFSYVDSIDEVLQRALLF